jgi:hypothetical protein
MKHTTAVRRALITSAAVALLGAAGTSAASAQRLATPDGTGDVWQLSSDSTTPTQAPDQTNGDITSTVVRYAKKVHLRIAMVDLKRTGQNGVVLMGSDVRTSAGKHYSVSMIGSYGHWRGQTELDNGRGKPVKCHVTGQFDYTANTGVVKIPGGCLGNPRWVRLGGPGVGTSTDLFSQTGSFYFDDALDPGYQGTNWTGRIHRF